MSRCDSVCCTGCTCVTWPRVSNLNSGSAVSSAIADFARAEPSAADAARAAASGAAHGSAARLAPAEDPVDAVVVQPLVRADERPVERGLDDLRPADLHLDRHREAVLERHERARLVRQRLGQHRLDPAGDVDARRAPVGLALDERARLDERAHVGDVHPHAPRVRPELLGRDRVVEVLRRRRVDRERRQVAQVAPRRDLLAAALGRLARLRARPPGRTAAAARGGTSAPRARRRRPTRRRAARTSLACPRPVPVVRTSAIAPSRRRLSRSTTTRRPRLEERLAGPELARAARAARRAARRTARSARAPPPRGCFLLTAARRSRARRAPGPGPRPRAACPGRPAPGRRASGRRRARCPCRRCCARSAGSTGRR